jgi:hypothetical protein
MNIILFASRRAAGLYLDALLAAFMAPPAF